MKKGMTVTYEVESGLYINMTNRCTNRCEFCIRNNGDGAYGSEPLWLMREPTVEEILESVFSRELEKYTEIVFCGYGEPTERLHDMCKVARAIKGKCPSLPIRVNTNGHSDLINGENTAHYFEGIFDVVSISLNTPNSEEYEKICHPVYREKAFPALLEFTKNVNKYVHKTLLSVVRQALSKEELRECEKIACELGVALRVRELIK